ncbi:MAG: MFS transporter [Rhodospirillales bacterium]|nr:MFS transporter [Rhodospirillales bacterium]
MTHWLRDWRRPEVLLILLSIAMPLSLSSWMALINNFAIERAAFDGAMIGQLQSLREVPGFLAFAVVFLLLLFREQTLAFVTLVLLGIGMAATGFLPTFWGLCLTTLISSIGFHYFETIRNSLSLQWTTRENAPVLLGRIIAAGSFASVAIFGLNWLALDVLNIDISWVFLMGGVLTIAITLFAWAAFPRFEEKVVQHRKLILRRRYWLYYALTFMQGARRQIFVVFAGFLMVEKFGFTAGEVSLMFLANMVINIYAAPRIGRLIVRLGERRALTIEYTGLIVVFSAYALVEAAWAAVILYILDHLFFAMAIAVKTYFQKIADPADIAQTAGVAFTINHIAAVVIPVAFGLLWLTSPGVVFMAGAGMAAASLLLTQLVPRDPDAGNEVSLPWRKVVIEAAE